jgi:hypothetical protein
MLKACHGFFDNGFNELLQLLADTYPEDNKVPANTYRVKKMIRPVAMKLKKFHACPNHYMRMRRAVCTVAQVGTRGMLVFTWTG